MEIKRGEGEEDGEREVKKWCCVERVMGDLVVVVVEGGGPMHS